MKQRGSFVFGLFLGICLMLTLFLFGGCSSSSSLTGGTINTGAFSLISGVWSGVWQDQDSTASGTIVADFSFTGTSVIAEGTINLSQLMDLVESGEISGDEVKFKVEASNANHGAAVSQSEATPTLITVAQ